MRRHLALSLLIVCTLAGPARADDGPSAGSVRFRAGLQPIDGFGFSQAFQRADVMRASPGARQILDLLLDREAGAGLSILRLGIGSSADGVYDHMRSIEPVDPGGPSAPPKYVWDGDDGGQVWLAKQAKAYGVGRFYADAWSAPGFMKDNGDDANGGALCGLPQTSCPSGDWRRAYANYLVRYTRFYRSEGIGITDLGFVNEPDLATSYASMRISPEQAASFAETLGPVARRAGLRLACCDAAGWTEQTAYTKAVAADPKAARWIGTYTGHPYVSPVTGPQPTDRHVWMSEWSPNGTTWDESWDDGSGYDGFAVASQIHDSLTTGGASGYVYWFGASTGATRGLIQLDGDAFHVSRRLWALAAYSRFIRPGATRVTATAADPALKISAYRDADGTRVIEILNTATSESTVNLALDSGGGRAASYVTDGDHALSRVDAVRVHGHALSADLGARSLTTLVLR
jgi:glucuronoarabinoxylan endo-1,4-beta-xylanase